MGKQNPLVSAPEPEVAEPVDLRDELLGETAVMTGPTEPGGATREAVANQSAWPRVKVTDHRLLTVAGLHGGAGTSTVASLFGGDAVDAGVGWPVAGGWVRPLPTLNVVVVARTHLHGLRTAQTFAQQWEAGELDDSRLLGMILVDDGPRLLDQQMRAVKRLLKMTPRGAHLPWVETWRVESPDVENLPRRLRKITREFRRLASHHTERNDP